MHFEALEIDGCFVIRSEPVLDERGSFVRIFSEREFIKRGLVSSFAQHSISFNSRRGTVRGLHFQAAPFSETKLVRCIKGQVFDVVVDIRRDSPTFLRWSAIELSAKLRNSVYIPNGCAHGFQT